MGETMEITLWSKQHKNAYKELVQKGELTVSGRYIGKDLDEQGHLILPCYSWLALNHPQRYSKPSKAEFLIWLSYTQEGSMLAENDTLLLKLSIPKELVTPIHVAKWGTILNYSYIPLNEEDQKRHNLLLKDYGVSDAKAFMSEFYPAIKREIIESWPRLFDPKISLDSQTYYGTIWYLKKEWLREVI